MRVLLGVAIAVWYLGLTVWSAQHLTTMKTLFETIQSCDPDSITAHETLCDYAMSIPPLNPPTAVSELESLMDRLFASSAWRTPDGALHVFQSDPRIALRANEHKSNALGSRSELAMLFTKLGLARLKNNDLSGANTAFETALQMQPTRVTPTVGLGECAYLRGEDVLAQSWAMKALSLNPNTVSAHLLLGKIFARHQQWQGAREAFENGLRLRPDSRPAALLLAEAQKMSGDATGAQQTLERAKSLDPDSENPELGQGYWHTYPYTYP